MIGKQDRSHTVTCAGVLLYVTGQGVSLNEVKTNINHDLTGIAHLGVKN